MSWNSVLLLTTLFFPPALTTSCEHRGSYSVSCNSLHLTSVPSNLLGDGVKSLEIADNNLRALPANSFAEYPSLTVLHLSNNRIRDIDDEAFEGLDNLHHLDLSHNEIENLNEDSLLGNPTLISLSLKGNPLVLSSTPMLSSNSISYLDLSYCNLSSLHAANFDNLAKLETINLRHNSLEYFPVDTFDNLPRLRHIYLHGNPWRCDVMQETLLKKRSVVHDYAMLPCVESGGSRVPESQSDFEDDSLEMDDTANVEAKTEGIIGALVLVVVLTIVACGLVLLLLRLLGWITFVRRSGNAHSDQRYEVFLRSESNESINSVSVQNQ